MVWQFVWQSFIYWQQKSIDKKFLLYLLNTSTQQNMNFEISKEANYTLIKVKVEKLDSQEAPELKSHIVMANKSGEKNLIIDLSETRYCDSSGLSALLVANRLTRDLSGTLVICSLQEPVMKLITISQLHNVLNITETLSDAKDLISAESVNN